MLTCARALSKCALNVMIRVHFEERQTVEPKMPREHRGISLLVFLPLCFISFGVERTYISRLGVGIIRKTRMKKLKAVDEDFFYEVTSSHPNTSAEVDYVVKLGIH